MEKKKGLLINPFFKAFQTEMGGFYICIKDQYIGRYVAYLSTAQTEVFILDSATLLLTQQNSSEYGEDDYFQYALLLFQYGADCSSTKSNEIQTACKDN